jgi:hypothetical protein
MKTMKTKILLLLAVVTFFSSCENDNNVNIAITEADLIGTWSLIEQTINGSIAYTDNGQTTTVNYDAFAKDIDMTLTFGENPKKVNAEGSYTLVTTINALGQSQTSEELAEAITDPAEYPTWALNGNNITLSNDYTLPQNLIVESYIGNILTLRADIDETETDNGQSVTIKTTAYFVLKK